MSAIAESLRRQRLPLLTLAVVLAVGMVAWSLISQTTAEHLTEPDHPVAAPASAQAPWIVDYSAEGNAAKLTTTQKARYAAQRARAAAIVQSVYDGLFLEPQQLDDLIARSFSTDAARSIDTRKLGLPVAATDVTTTTRKAVVALDAETADFAISRVTVVAEATLNDRTIEVEHRSTLWLERHDNTWKVIAFDLEQGPAK